MPTVEHSTLSGSELHDPLYIAFSGVIDDISTASTIYIPMPYAGTVKRITTVLGGAIATANAGITVKNSAAASMGSITVAFTGSAAGDTDNLDPASNNTVTANDYITVETDGASTNTVKLYVSVTVEPS